MANTFGFNIIPKEMFFDAKKIIDAVERGKLQALSKQGAFVRQRARQLTGVRTKISAAPGKPPRLHAGQLHDLIYFAVDREGKRAIIGPLVFKDGIAPNVLEFGGEEVLQKKVFRTRNGRVRLEDKKFPAKYRGNPFMGPSLRVEVESGNISSAWKGAVRS
jgi:hypothetical protein